MNTTRLKPCPFCGREAKVVSHSFECRDDFREETYGVKCTYCGIQTNQFYVSEEMAESAWNRRVTDG